MFLDDTNYGVFPLSMNMGKLLGEFLIEFEELLSALRKHCKSVKVEYGLIKYYS